MAIRLVRKLRRFVPIAGAIALLGVGWYAWKPCALAVYYHRAADSLAVGDQHGALELLRVALRLDPERADTCLLLARTHRRLGNFAQASQLLRCAAKWGGETEISRRETWLLDAATGRLRQAEPHLADLLIDSQGDAAEISEAYVQGYLINLRVEPALRLLDAWQEDDPNDGRPFLFRGRLWERLGERAKAADAFRRALQVDPENTAIRRRLAELLLEDPESLEEAADLLRRCFQEEPGDPEVLIAWARCLKARGEIDAARELLGSRLPDIPEHPEGNLLLGQIELAEGRPAEAVGRFREAAQRRPYDVAVHRGLGQALRALGRTEEADAHFQYVAEAEPALAHVERLIRIAAERPDDAQVRFEIGATVSEYGPPEEAAKWLRAALEIDPGHAAARRNLSLLCQPPQLSSGGRR